MTTADDRSPLDAWLREQEELAQLFAHDFKNPLAAVLANLSFLELSLRDADPEVRETLVDVRTSAELLLRLIDNQAAIARLESPTASAIPRVPVALAMVVRTAVARCASSAASVPVTLTHQAGVDATVSGDPSLLELMVMNLVGNAIQHTRRGASVSVRVVRDEDRAAVVLSDAGVPFGDPASDFSRTAQSRLKFAPSGRYSRGLGLYLVGLVASAFGGSIEPSREGEASVLRVWFPLA